MDQKMVDELFNKLNLLIKLTALNVVGGRKRQDKISVLSEVGLKPNQIGQILGLKSNYVTAALSNIKKTKCNKTARIGKK